MMLCSICQQFIDSIVTAQVGQLHPHHFTCRSLRVLWKLDVMLAIGSGRFYLLTQKFQVEYVTSTDEIPEASYGRDHAEAFESIACCKPITTVYRSFDDNTTEERGFLRININQQALWSWASTKQVPNPTVYLRLQACPSTWDTLQGMVQVNGTFGMCPYSLSKS